MNNGPNLDSLLKRMAEEHQASLPSPNLIWWRAQLQKKYEQKRRAERPTELMRLIAALVSLAYPVVLWAQDRQEALVSGRWVLVPIAIVVLTASLVSASLLWSTISIRWSGLRGR